MIPAPGEVPSVFDNAGKRGFMYKSLSRMAVVTMKKQYPGHAKRVMLGVWSFLRQFMYTKCVIVTDDDINARDWTDVIWAGTTRMDPKRESGRAHV